MKRTFRQSANVLPGGKIELSVPDLPVGTSVDVTLDVELAQGDGKPLFVGMFYDEPEVVDELMAEINHLRAAPMRVDDASSAA